MNPLLRALPTRLSLLLALGIMGLVAGRSDANQTGVKLQSVAGIRMTTQAIMTSPIVIDARVAAARNNWEPKDPDRSLLPESPDAPAVSNWPMPVGSGTKMLSPQSPMSPQVPDLSFTGATLAETGSFPPDNMGCIGPNQFFMFVN